MTTNEHETQDRRVDLLKDIGVEREGTGWVFHIREAALGGAQKSRIRLIVSHSLRFQTARQSANSGEIADGT